LLRKTRAGDAVNGRDGEWYATRAARVRHPTKEKTEDE
jgi:hypothetical protein